MTTSQEMGYLLVGGGEQDPNIGRLLMAAQRKEIPLQSVQQQEALSPGFSWYLSNPTPENQGYYPDGTESPKLIRGAFLRYDVFGTGVTDSKPKPKVQKRALGWYQTVQGWLLSQPQVRLFNRHMSPIASNKLAALSLANQVGLTIPDTWITNAASQIQSYAPESAIAKPVAGGGFCRSLDELQKPGTFRNGKAAMPAIVQKRLVAPEVRIYVIGNHTLAFEMRSPNLDYRVHQDAQVIPVEVPEKEAKLLRQLMGKLNMDFGAADFKTNPETNEFVFLELNTSPMFARFDQESNGTVCDAMVDTLYGL